MCTRNYKCKLLGFLSVPSHIFRRLISAVEPFRTRLKSEKRHLKLRVMRLVGCPRGFVFLRNDNLETSRTSCRGIDCLVRKDNRRAWIYDVLSLQKISRQSAFLRRKEEAFIRAVFSCSGHFYSTEMSVRIRSLESAENIII